MNRSIECDDHIYQFGPFCLNAGERVLLKDGRLVPLAPKTLSTLLVLVRNMGHVMEKSFLMDEVWPDEDVEEANLAQQVYMLRKALGESPNYIETIPRRGYRFLQPRSEIHRLSKGHTENIATYEAFLKARYCWSQHTKEGLKQAIRYFCQAIDLEPDYAPAYAGAVDCYLRLATNYFPPSDALIKPAAEMGAEESRQMLPGVQSSVEIRCAWDRELAKREHRHADELGLDYPAVHQWQAAYRFAMSLYHQNGDSTFDPLTDNPPIRLQSRLTPSEEAQVFCVIAREQIDAGNYDAACAVLKRWWTMGEWPKLDGLNSRLSADLLLTAGTLAGFVSSARQVPRGQKHAQALLNGAIGLFEQLGFKTLSAEGRIQLGVCYGREGLFDLARTTFSPALEVLSEEGEVRSYALLSLARVEFQTGRLGVAQELLTKADNIVDHPSPEHKGHYHQTLAATLHASTISETHSDNLYRALEHYLKAIDLWEAVGHHRYAATGQNNHGYLLITLGRLDEAEPHLVRGRKVFDALNDKRRCAQVDDSLARFYLTAGRLDLAGQAAERSVRALETGGLEALLVESLTTQGLVLCKLGRHREAKRVLDRAYQIAERCGDTESACTVLLTVIEKMGAHLGEEEKLDLLAQLDRFLPGSQASTVKRIKKLKLGHQTPVNILKSRVSALI